MTYYEKNKLKIKEYYEINKDFFKQYNKEYYRLHRTELLKKNNENHMSYYKLNSERIKERHKIVKNYGKEYVKENLVYDRDAKKYINFKKDT
jgi:hypothetical protein